MEAGAAEGNHIPQSNESYCGHQCGRGCCEPLSSGHSLSDGTSTLVESEDEISSLELSVRPQMSVDTTHVASTSSHVDAETNDHGANIFANVLALTTQGLLATSQLSQYGGGSMEYQEDAVLSRSRNMVALDSVDGGTVSSGNLVRGVGSWDVNNEAERFPLQYHFLATPLRLSPQCEHCRSRPVLHMVVQEDIVLLDYVEEDWGSQALLSDHVRYYNEECRSL